MTVLPVETHGRGVLGGTHVGWVEPPGPALGRPDDKLRETHRSHADRPGWVSRCSTHPTRCTAKHQSGEPLHFKSAAQASATRLSPSTVPSTRPPENQKMTATHRSTNTIANARRATAVPQHFRSI